MMTIEQHWEDLAAKALPAGAPPIQRREMKRAFYAGVASAMKVIDEATELPEEEAMAAMNNMYKELIAFGVKLTIGAA